MSVKITVNGKELDAAKQADVILAHVLGPIQKEEST